MAETKAEGVTILRALRALLESGEGADVTLVVNGSEIPAHSLILSAMSPVFAAMLRHDMVEARSRRIEITDVREAVVRQVLWFMYTDTAPQLESMAAELFAAADKYDLPVLRQRCERQMARDVSVENAAATAALAVQYRCEGLRDAAMQFIAGHLEVLATAGWEQVMRENLEAAVEISKHVAAGNKSLSPEERNRRLIEAAIEGKADELSTLLAAGADVGARDVDEKTALHHAASGGHEDMARFLLEAGAQVDARDKWQNTPLHEAAYSGHAAVVHLLLSSSADPNARDEEGMTPLHDAARRGHADTVAALLEEGADRGPRNQDGNTPLDLARQNHQKLIQILS